MRSRKSFGTLFVSLENEKALQIPLLTAYVNGNCESRRSGDPRRISEGDAVVWRRPVRDSDTDKGGGIARRRGKNGRKGRNDGPRINGRRIKIKERREREKEREGEEEMWAKSVFLSWPAAAKAWPGSTMTHSLAPLVPPAAPSLGGWLSRSGHQPQTVVANHYSNVGKAPFRFQIQLVIVDE